MLARLIILTIIVQIKCSSICDSENCVCWYENVVNEDSVGENIQCSYSDANILHQNHTLPGVVRSLDLSSNNITVIQPSVILNSTTMVELLLNNNIITEIKPDSFKLPALKRLDLSNNLLEFIDKEVFRDVKSLEYLNLANNRFTTFNKLTFHPLSNLNEIILDNNDLGGSLTKSNLFDRSGFGLTNKIQNISIRGINLHVVPDNFFVDAYDLRKLTISNNNISEVFELPFTLQYLDLSDNPITGIFEEDFTDLIALKTLKLNNLQIKEVPEFAFENLHSLTTLELERNMNLVKFDKLAFGQEVLADPDVFTLEKLSVKGSRLSQLDEALSTPFGQLIELDLQGNPWQCNCKILWVKQLQISKHLTDHVRCATPTTLFNARIFDLKSKYFTCEKRHIGIIVAVISVCGLLSISALWIFYCIPKRKSRSTLCDLYTSSAAYSALPMGTNLDRGS